MRDKFYFIAEIGVNHDGCLEKAKNLVRLAKEAGTDCVKFQTYKTDLVVSKMAPKAEYQKIVTDEFESQYKMLERLEFKYEWFPQIINYCKELNIDFLTTPNNFEDIDFLVDLGLNEFKVASYQATELPYLEYIAKRSKKIYLSLGMTTTSEAIKAIEVVSQFCEVIPLQCTTNYPSLIEHANIGFVRTLLSLYPVVGYSCHVNNNVPTLVAASFGAKVFEKHFTYSKSAEGPDHSSSYVKEDIQELIIQLCDVYKSIGSNLRKPFDVELSNQSGMKRSLFTKGDLIKGQILNLKNIEFKRPLSGGIEINHLNQVIGRTIKTNLKDDTQLKWTDLD
jgi:N,N'-diacetyllegionaminate synthase